MDLLRGLDLPAVSAIEARAEAVLADPLFWLPVRHHSPALARLVGRAIRARRPRVVFIEGPAEATSLVQHITDPKTKPPIAIYSSYRDDDDVLGLAGIASPAPDVPAKFGVWYPLLAYSPEYVAMKAAKDVAAEVVFIDLPHHGLLKRRPPETAPSKDGEPDGGAPAEVENTAERLSWDSLAVESSFYVRLAEAAGYRSWAECWDTLFEVGAGAGRDDEGLRRDMTYFCAAIRATTPNARMARDGTLAREAFMWRAVSTTLAARKLAPTDAVVVCGGFHVFMDRSPPPPPELPAGTVYSTVAPYSYYRTSELSGYGAGNRAPRWYERLFDAFGDLGRDEASVAAMVDHVVAVLARGRKDGELLSSADAISVTQHARMLATLRGRAAPTLDDVRDGVLSCCCKGRPEEEGRYLLAAMTAVEIGTAVGRVTAALGRLPLVYDFYRAIDELDLGEALEKDKKQKLTLDLRDEAGQRRSVLFHRLAQLGVGFAEPVPGGDATRLFHETWRVQWSPKVEAALIEQNLYGDTLEAAAAAKLDEELAKDENDAGVVCDRLLRATNMDLPGLVLRIQETAGHAIDADTRVTSLARALGSLAVLERQAARKKIRPELVQDLQARAFARACFAIPDVANVPAEEHDAVIDAMKTIAELLLGERRDAFDRELFVDSVRRARAACTTPYLAGAMVGLLTEIRAQTPDDLAREVAAFALARPEVMLHCGEFLDGAMATSKTGIMLGAGSLVKALDDLLRAASWEWFLVMLPRTRKAFERLHDRSRVAFADRVAEMYGLASGEGDAIATLSTPPEVAAWMASLDARVGTIMKDWTSEAEHAEHDRAPGAER